MAGRGRGNVNSKDKDSATPGRGVVWGEDETECLLEIWNDESIKAQLSTTHRNAKVFQEFSERMKAAGYNRTPVQCRIKVKKLRQKYLGTRDKMRRSGESADIKDTCPLYDELDDILGHGACANPPNIVEGGSVDMEKQGDEDMDSSIDDAEEETAGPSSIHPPVPNTFRSPDASTSARASCSSSKSNKKSVTQEITSLISSVLEQQRRDHELFMLKEDQRLEREMEMERERYRLHMEMEERRRQAQIESDQATMRLIAQVLTTVAKQSNHPTNPTNSLHTLTPVQHTNTMASSGDNASEFNTEQPLSSVLHELNRFH